MGFQIVAMIVGLLVIGAAPRFGASVPWTKIMAWRSGAMKSLHEVYLVGSHLATASTLLAEEHGGRDRAQAEVLRAASLFELFTSGKEKRGSTVPAVYDRDAAAAVKVALGQAVKQFQPCGVADWQR